MARRTRLDQTRARDGLHAASACPSVILVTFTRLNPEYQRILVGTVEDSLSGGNGSRSRRSRSLSTESIIESSGSVIESSKTHSQSRG